MLANLENDDDVSEFVDKVIVSFHNRLVRGGLFTKYAPERKKRRFFGGLHIVTGDHIGQVALMGKKGPTSEKPARFDNITKDQIPEYHKWQQNIQDTVAMKAAKVKKDIETAELFLQHSEHGKAATILNMYGFSKIVRTRRNSIG